LDGVAGWVLTRNFPIASLLFLFSIIRKELDALNALYTPEAQVLRLAFVALVGIYFFHGEDK
jgi:hypothetical protein